MLVDLVRVTTPDGCLLDGALQRPENDVVRAVELDGVCLIHGTGSNFYQSTLMEFFAENLLAQGVAVLRANTRGHDGVSTLVTAKGGTRLGAAYERVDDCRHDLRGWVDFMRAKVGPTIGLLGHSLGAVKCLYAAAHDPDLAPAAVIAVSPPRLSFAAFAESERGPEFLEAISAAQTLAEQGRGEVLMEATIPLPMLIAAGGYLEKYGPDERYQIVPLVKRLETPTLFLFGEKEVRDNVAFQRLPEELGELGREVVVIEGGDHFYTGVRGPAWNAIHRWLRRG